MSICDRAIREMAVEILEDKLRNSLNASEHVDDAMDEFRHDVDANLDGSVNEIYYDAIMKMIDNMSSQQKERIASERLDDEVQDFIDSLE